MNPDRLTNEQLLKELEYHKRIMEQCIKSLSSRSGKATYRCEECGLENDNSDVIYRHLKSFHGYPDEDAGISTQKIFV